MLDDARGVADPSSLKRELHGVGKQIEKNLFDLPLQGTVLLPSIRRVRPSVLIELQGALKKSLFY
jgi:hypothetical protein